MGRVVVVTSGKGGVGKTTTTAAIGAALAQSGQYVCVVDFDVDLQRACRIVDGTRRAGDPADDRLVRRVGAQQLD